MCRKSTGNKKKITLADLVVEVASLRKSHEDLKVKVEETLDIDTIVKKVGKKFAEVPNRFGRAIKELFRND